MADMMKPRVRSSAGDNSSVNSAAFGKIAQSASKPKPNSAEQQQGDENQREWFNGVRGGLGIDANGQRQKVSRMEKDGAYRATSQRAGGKGK